ncbi:MAG: hypothetical protein HKN15_10575 [Xanthomonadales bacterium]|nr:hypothetical protein [Xanthomonadales bacterium]
MGYPLTAALTARIVKYLIIFRLIISSSLIFAFNFGSLVQGDLLSGPTLAGTALGSYLVLAAYFVYEARKPETDFYLLARITLAVDIGFLGLMFIIFGGLGSGLALLLVFITACAAILLPLRVALFLASMAALAIICEAIFGGVFRSGQPDNLIRSGLYCLTILITAVLAHLLAYSVRDYRLIAERQQQTLTRLEQINELIIRRMRSGVLAVDAQSEIQMMNESAWFLLGSPPALERELPEISSELYQAMIDWRENPTADTPALTLQASQAQVVPKFVSLPGDRDIRVLIFLEDNDVVAQRALELSANSLAKLSGSIAHEIRNPLSAVSHAAQLLAESEQISDQDMRLLDIIQNQSRRMNGIVENILQLSRREKSRPEMFELNDWLEQTVEEFDQSLAREDIELVFSASQEEPSTVMFDRSQLHQALWKLLDNAVEHAGREDRAPRITVHLNRQVDTGYAVITVEDNGAGIPEDRIGNIFEPFYTTRQQGSGLGLYVARQLCEANQAELTVDSSAQQGTRFHLRLATTKNHAKDQLEDALEEQQES